MNNRLSPLFHWLTFAALADWMVTRTLTRAGVFIPKSPAWISAYRGAAVFGQGASTLAGLLVLATLGWVAWQEWQTHRKMTFPAILLTLAGMSLLFLFIPAVGWLSVANLLLLLVALGLIFWRARQRPWLLIPILALIASSLYQLLPALYEALHLAGPPPFTLTLFNLGEVLVVLSGLGYGWLARRGATRREWILAAIPAIAFSGMFLAVPAMAGIFSIWSMGLTLFLPWPLYTISVWSAGVAILKTMREKSALGWGILLLAAGGYASQLSTQSFYGLIALWMLVLTINEENVQQNERADIQKLTKLHANAPAQ